MKQRWNIPTLCLVVWILIGLSYHQSFGGEAISRGMNIPEFTLDMPNAAKVSQYLGVNDFSSFSLSEINSKLVLLELFSLYCPICQKQAPIANKLYKYISRDSELNQDIKMIGIGVGNNQKEVSAFRARFRVPFPLFFDPNFDIHKKFGEPRTPFTVLATNSGEVLLIHNGIVKDIDDFLLQIRKLHNKQ